MAGPMEQGKKKILVLIPAFNEGEQIAAIVKEVQKELPEAMVLVINDGSSDQTAGQAAAAGAKVLTHPFNMGYGVALQTGYKFALRSGYDCVLQMDGDGQHDPRYLRRLLAAVEEGQADVALGSRFLGPGGYRAPFFRRMGMRLFGFLASRLSGQKFSDPTSGYQALNRRAINFCVKDSFPGDYPDADVLILMRRLGLRIREIPVEMQPSLNGRSMHSGWKPLYYIYKMLLSISLNLIRRD